GVEIQKLIMAMSYGDQLTNMLQPFWALPLLGITQLSAKDILPYCLLVFGAGVMIFTLSLLVF
ncbi:MAG: TIGR00366 family protein, partial [Chitinophagales bacterium]|nr:TIGR00366 family protein [Chitinophagales bacterium]